MFKAPLTSFRGAISVFGLPNKATHSKAKLKVEHWVSALPDEVKRDISLAINNDQTNCEPKTLNMEASTMEVVSNVYNENKRSTDDEGFVTVPKKFAARPRIANATTPVATHNIFEDLPIDPASTEERAGPARTDLLRPPPFVISPPIAAASLKPQLLSRGVTHLRRARETRLFLQVPADHPKVWQMLLEDKNINFHSFAPRGTKKDRRFLLYGFDRDHPLEQIINELTKRLSGFKKASRLTKTLANGEKIELSSILVVTDGTVTLKKLRQLRQIDYIGFRAAVFKTDKGPVQCYHCFEFGHTAQYCGRTGYCGGPHRTHQCQKQTRPKCLQCRGDHPTTFRLCPKRQKIIQELKDKREEKKAKKAGNMLPYNRTRPGFSYAAATAGPAYSEAPQTYEHMIQPSCINVKC